MRSRPDRPFVDTPAAPLTAVRSAAERFASDHGLALPELIRLGMNGVFRTGEVVLRVGRPTASAATALALADWLADGGVRVPVPILHPQIYDGWTVTGWERAVPSGEPIGWAEVGSMIAKVHALGLDDVPVGYPVPSPAAFPWWDFEGVMIELSDSIDAKAAAGLSETIVRNASWRDVVASDTRLCHGDVHPGNVVMTDRGPVLLDWDLLCAAPPAWDHAMLLTLAERWGGADDVYLQFARGYGCSLRHDPTARMFAELRNVAATLMRVRAGTVNPAARAEADRRLRFWRGDIDAPIWRAQ